VTLSKGAPLDLSVVAVDDASDALDAPSTFIARFVVETSGATCTAGLTTQDTNADTFADTFVNVPAATPVCWSLVTKATAALAPAQAPRVFKARIDARAEGFSVVDSSEVVFIVPPAP
jgi:hypothetical protein